MLTEKSDVFTEDTSWDREEKDSDGQETETHEGAEPQQEVEQTNDLLMRREKKKPEISMLRLVNVPLSQNQSQ